MAGADEISYRPVRVIALLMILQVAGLAGLGAYEFLGVDWRGIRPDALPDQVLETAVLVFFVPPAVMMFLSALSFLFLRRKGWLLAAIGEGLTLAVCLWLYSEFQPWYVYPAMAYCVLMVLYLNSQDVRVLFHPRRKAARQEPGGAA